MFSSMQINSPTHKQTEERPENLNAQSPKSRSVSPKTRAAVLAIVKDWVLPPTR